MTFTQRLVRFLMGGSIGLVFVAMAFGPRAFSCNYFPNARVLEEARAKKIKFSSEAMDFFEAEKLDSVFVYKNLLTKSKIDFDKSNKDGKPCRTYLADYNNESKNYQMVIEICKEDSKLVSITKK